MLAIKRITKDIKEITAKIKNELANYLEYKLKALSVI